MRSKTRATIEDLDKVEGKAELVHGEMRFSAPWIQNNLVQNVLPGLEGVVQRLQSGADVADVGCGSGRALIEMAKTFPASRFQGFDSAPIAIQRATQTVSLPPGMRAAETKARSGRRSFCPI